MERLAESGRSGGCVFLAADDGVYSATLLPANVRRSGLTAQAHAQTATDQQNAENDRSDYDQIKPDHKDARGRVVRVVGTFSAELSESVADLSLDGAGHIRSTVVFRFLSHLFGVGNGGEEQK